MNLEEFMHRSAAIMRTLQRLCNEYGEKFVKKYQDDPTCADLRAVLQQDWEAAFRGCIPSRA
ncbi:MAG: hypothetical protein ACLSF2_07390 [Butyricicoccus sp.]